MPDLHPDEYLHRIWSEELGEAREGQPLEWQELKAYADTTGQDLEPEEWRILREMSVAYCAQLRNLNRFEDMSLSPLGKALQDD